ncbi:DUF1631 domain-containing protein [Caldimonas aquatica]|uniref:DUF1631 domain-containing protein n=2 Tax=Pseudomonadota TaxID=1224 RepID=A0ABY6MTL1_9BURK|nr:DUF1631 domain-containing protein [Schlegelella aquatica]UZD55319.1 DUF1631 domain-containing protein [Schlegelella aquatica]
MATSADPRALAIQARRRFLSLLRQGLSQVLLNVEEGAKQLATQPAPPELLLRRRDAWADLQRLRPALQAALIERLDQRDLQLQNGGFMPTPVGLAHRGAELSLVDDATIEHEILSSRLALAAMDLASFEFSDLRSRMQALERREDLANGDVLRPHVVARDVLDAWRSVGLSLECWRSVQPIVHEELAHLMVLGYHETNKSLIGQGVLPEIDLRPMIRRARDVGVGPSAVGSRGGELAGSAGAAASGAPSGSGSPSVRGAVGEETRLMTRSAQLLRAPEQAQAVLGRLNRLVGQQVPGFQPTTVFHSPSPRLVAAIAEAERDVAQRLRSTGAGGMVVSAPQDLVEDLQHRKQALKRAAESPIERATIEIVALLFQSILTEERLPASVRVWFARLQMPVLRVAVSEPDFFATLDHPARKLIDRMGACVMGFDASTAGAMGEALEKEIKRVVQVVEAYPDTGRRVFQTVLVEFEKFLEHYFRNENEVSRKGVSLAQQVEQREILAIQYTIELRKMLNEVPVQEGVREFLFQIWADVLAMTAVKTGAQSEQTKAMKRAAADLIWSASAKVSREERAEVIRRLPPLLKTLREGMANAGVPTDKQDAHLQALNNSLAAAFTAKTAAIPPDRLDQLMLRLETLEEMLPDTEVEIDESMVLDLSDHETRDLEVVAEGGSIPSPAMIAWARGLQVGSWFKLDYRGRNEPVQLAWLGLRKQLSLFVSPTGRCVLFQQHRLAAFLQAGLLVPAEEEALTVRATRDALAKLDADPSRLLS